MYDETLSLARPSLHCHRRYRASMDCQTFFIYEEFVGMALLNTV